MFTHGFLLNSKYYEKDALVADPEYGSLLGHLLGEFNILYTVYVFLISFLFLTRTDTWLFTSYFISLICNVKWRLVMLEQTASFAHSVSVDYVFNLDY